MNIKTFRLKQKAIVAASAAAAAAVILPAWRPHWGLLPVGILGRIAPWGGALAPLRGNPILSDQLLEFWPWRIFLRDALRSGRFPLWNPLIMGGVPFAACVQAAPFFPTTLLLPILTPAAWSVAAAALKIFIASLMTGLFAARLGASRRGAALSAVSFGLCGFMIAWLGHPQTNAACGLPFLFWALHRADKDDDFSSWKLAALAVGFILLGGHPPTALQVLAAGAAYAAWLSARRGGDRKNYLFAAAGAGFLGVGLASIALFPYFEYLPLSSTADSAQALARWSTRLSPWVLLHLLIPNASGSPVGGAQVLAAVFDLNFASNFIERAGWIGVPATFFAACAALKSRPRSTERFLAWCALFALAAAFGVPPLPQLWRILPGFSAVNPTRWLLLFCFSASVLAGRGVDLKISRRMLLAAAGVFILAEIIYAWRLSLYWGELSAGERGFAVGEMGAFAFESAAAAALAVFPRARDWAAPIAGFFLLRLAWGINPAAPENYLYPSTPATQTLARLQGDGRILGVGAVLAPDTPMALGLRDARGRDFITLRRYEKLLTGEAGNFAFFEGARGLPPAFALLGISAIATDPASAAAVPKDWTLENDQGMLVFRAPRAVSRAMFVPTGKAVPPAAALSLAGDVNFIPDKTVLIDDGGAVAAPQNSAGRADISAETANSVDINVQSAGPGWVLLLDSWYPGWRASVDGERAEIRRADYAFRAVYVPAGAKHVRMTYVPSVFWLGAAVSGLTMAALLIF